MFVGKPRERGGLRQRVSYKQFKINKMKRLFKRMVIGFTVFFLPLLTLVAQNDVGNIKCTLKGEVIDRPQVNRLILLKAGEDPRVNGVHIPVNDGKFEYVLNCKHEELYGLLIDDGLIRAIKPVEFISEQGVINFTLYNTERYDVNNSIKGGVLTKEYLDFDIEGINKQKVLMEELNTKILKLGKDAPDISSVAKTLQDSLIRELAIWVLQCAKERPTIVGYSIMMQYGRTFIEILNDISPVADVYQTVFAPKFPNHPYTAKMINLFTGSSLKAGVSFIDFTAVDMNGNPVKLSERIAGKTAILHLWASWCGPCRQKGKDLIPVYEEFRDKGFVVIGVARERNTSAAAEAAIKLDKYTWENLVEINDKEQIWAKYGIGNAAGSDFLIDEKGNILAVAPSIEEIKNFLKTK